MGGASTPAQTHTLKKKIRPSTCATWGSGLFSLYQMYIHIVRWNCLYILKINNTSHLESLVSPQKPRFEIKFFFLMQHKKQNMSCMLRYRCLSGQMQASRGWRPTTRQDQHYWSDKNPVLSPSRDFKFYLIHIDVSRQHASLSSSSSYLWSTPPWVLFLKCKCVWWRTVSGFCNNQRKYNRSSRQHTFLFSVHDQCRALTEVQQSACSGSTRLLLDDLHCLSQGLFYCLCHSHWILILIS